jgi:ABC-2 type transport system ATP-binding protein
MDTLVEARGVQHAIGTRSILTGLALTIARGEVVGVAGPNGAGKSTLGRLLLGFTSPTSGTITIGGTDPATHRRTHGVGFLHEDGGRGWEHATPRALLALQVEDLGALTRDPICQTLGIATSLDRRVATLSKGQWRACQLAMALLPRSTFVLLDEPEAGLDPGAQDRLHEVITMRASAGTAILMLSHHLDSLAAVAARIHLLVRGGFHDHINPAGLSMSTLRLRYSQGVDAALATTHTMPLAEGRAA